MKEVKEVKEVKKNDLDGRVCALERLVGKAIKWIEEVHGADVNGDGKVGSVRIGLIGIIAILGVVGSVLATETVDDKSAGTGTYTLTQASNGTGDITLTVDAVASDVTGSVSGATALGLTGGAFSIQDSTQLVFIVSGVATNVIDADITTP